MATFENLFNISVEELVTKGARKEGFLLRKQFFISNKFLSKIVKIKKCKYFYLSQETEFYT
jgi:hypothetical protein